MDIIQSLIDLLRKSLASWDQRFGSILSLTPSTIAILLTLLATSYLIAHLNLQVLDWHFKKKFHQFKPKYDALKSHLISWITLTILTVIPARKEILEAEHWLLDLFSYTYPLLILLGIYTIHRVIDLIFQLLQEQARRWKWNNEGILQLLQSLAQLLTILATAVIIPTFYYPNYNIEKWLQNFSIGLGTLTAILALASKDVIANFFGALVITLGRNFSPQDWIKIDKVEGKVIAIGMRATKIRPPAGGIIHIPNQQFVNKQIYNYGKLTYAKITTTILCQQETTESDIKETLNTIETLLGQHRYFIKKVSRIEITTITLQKITLNLHLYTKEKPNLTQKVTQQRRLLEKINNLLKEKKMTLSF